MKWNEKPIVDIPKRPRLRIKTYVEYVKNSDYFDSYKDFVIRNYQNYLKEHIHD